MEHARLDRSWGLAWLGLALALALHVLDEAAHGFLAVWNPSVTALRDRVPWLPLPTFTFPVWIGGLAAGIALLLLLAPGAFRALPWMRPLSLALATVMVANALAHVAASLAGVWSSPLLLVAAANLLWQASTSPRRQTSSPSAV